MKYTVLYPPYMYIYMVISLHIYVSIVEDIVWDFSTFTRRKAHPAGHLHSDSMFSDALSGWGMNHEHLGGISNWANKKFDLWNTIWWNRIFRTMDRADTMYW